MKTTLLMTAILLSTLTSCGNSKNDPSKAAQTSSSFSSSHTIYESKECEDFREEGFYNLYKTKSIEGLISDPRYKKCKLPKEECDQLIKNQNIVLKHELHSKEDFLFMENLLKTLGCHD